MLSALLAVLVASAPSGIQACADDDWYHPEFDNILAKRIQPGAVAARPQPIDALQWGQFNILHTTDTHGWYQAHVTDPNYSADYGDFLTFVQRMKAKADVLGVDLLVADSGDLHDGTGYADLGTSLNGELSVPIFKTLPYDLLSIGNHELYTPQIANDTYYNLAPNFGGRYLTSNVDFYVNGSYRPFSQRYAHWQTKFGVRVMSFGVLYNFTGNTNLTRVQPALNMTRESWFQTQIQRRDIDLFLLVGHTPPRNSYEWNVVYAAIRQYHPNTPITILGGHSHIRDTTVFDAAAVGFQSGRYCETVGWLSMTGLNASRANRPSGTLPAITASPSNLAAFNVTSPPRNSSFGYSRSYLDFNRATFEFHTNTTEATFNTTSGVNLTRQITAATRVNPNLTNVLGCTPMDYYQNRVPLNDSRNLYTLFTDKVLPPSRRLAQQDIHAPHHPHQHGRSPI